LLDKIKYLNLGMKLTFDAETLSIEEQKALYLHLKAIFDPDSYTILTDADRQKEALLNKSLKEIRFSPKTSVVIAHFRLRIVRDLFDIKRSQVKHATRGGFRVCDEIETVLAELGLNMKLEK
jgi:hypothetical protein